MGTKRADWVVVGISGVTNGGKTTLSLKLKELLYPSVVLCQDQYFFSEDSDKHVKVVGLEHNNYDIISSLNMELMTSDILKLLDDFNPDFLRESKNIVNDAQTFPGKKILIVEGFLILNYKPISDLCDYKCYLELTKEECLRRRSKRTYDPPDTPGYFELCVWPEYLRYRNEIGKMADVKIMDGTEKDILEKVLEDIKRMINTS